ncbi:hypothetical protein Bsp3421_000066 (plasmid) [Burkholderia sp. FERM BP-3421]|uniref:hypothetical protein n=1 Tax=Burkholderia sp. FERM BP-3421 TaxID=1494466 RepID=UPI0023615085|nr:hypothetical protein [Burkholderia sp. FERM BP-3421]WDD90245.1 hypothetical protein Bsp3421_000066 [Burkholderia sp. FERM BP-3421]
MSYQIDTQATRDKVMRFLNEVGIPVRYEVGATGFVDGCRIDHGTLAVDPACRVSSVLHEGGHLAITPGCFRTLMDGNLFAGQREMLRILDEAELHPDHPLYRAVIQCSDPEATAWAWAAGIKLGLPGDEIIRDDEYDGEGEDIRLSLKAAAYFGVHGLAHAGFCELRERNGIAPWPHMKFWTQEVERL